MKRSLETPYKLYAIDFKYPHVVRAKLKNIERYYLDLVNNQHYDVRSFINMFEEELEHFQRQIERNLFEIAPYDFLTFYDELIFEGSQGILLDMDHGFFPNVTYANTTSKNAIEICNKLNIDPEIWYVTRCYQTRHGNGWMSNTGAIELINTEEEINKFNDWQGIFRIQEIDYDLINYAIEIDANYCTTAISKNLMVTCLDQRPDFKFDYDRINEDIFLRHECIGPENDLAYKKIRNIKKNR